MEAAKLHGQANVIFGPPPTSPVEATGCHQPHAICISMPASPSGLHVAQVENVLLVDKAGPTAIDGQPNQPSESDTVNSQQPKPGKFHSQPIPAGNSYDKATRGKVTDPFESQLRISRNDGQRDKRFDSFKTWSGKLERQLSNLRGKPQEPDVEANACHNAETETVPAVDRYFDALEGPELDTLRVRD